ncbi:hypothetical protein [Mucilaginibacter phyllosphaerae]|uniref:Uncharacterized protein n=1 Tax=Mucilaginibacter phyllosphaerae TaxID=1812349 RepID=A0A4Y8AHK3_9SPHI|nr:hypothetical protein [Mucilaginibacter phyllosphaerae]MBB3968719.1 hypothetical protein [Mucilaginibacter phyllosphaerae]TEW67645.1 hypothetical protein E2R65_06550 [Mucilaginibacter phyllosphaerae]GGH14301.1 hypothetical protein GCM10007352_22310 [Mucilaginibacter phyllosphaerae]
MPNAIKNESELRPQVIWELNKNKPGLMDELQAVLPGIKQHYQRVMESIGEEVGLDPFKAKSSVRPIRHLRAWYDRLDGSGVIAVKGTEIIHQHIPKKLNMLKQLRVDYPSRGRSLFSVLEHFPIVEQKIPMAVTVEECMQDMENALAFQSEHIRLFKKLAHCPLPLAIFKWTETQQAAFMNILLPLLSGRSSQIVQYASSKGLGGMLYYYPQLPIRVAHIDLEWQLPDNDYQGRLKKIKDNCDPASAVNTWVDNLARMLVCKMMPGSIESIGAGHCLEAQNAVVDGGFVDLGSMKKFEDISTAQEFTETLSAAIIDLSNTIRMFLAGRLADPVAEYRNPSVMMLHTTFLVYTSLFKSLRSYQQEITLDARLAAFLDQQSLFQDLDKTYSALYPKHDINIAHNKPGSNGTSL